MLFFKYAKELDKTKKTKITKIRSKLFFIFFRVIKNITSAKNKHGKNHRAFKPTNDITRNNFFAIENI